MPAASSASSTEHFLWCPAFKGARIRKNKLPKIPRRKNGKEERRREDSHQRSRSSVYQGRLTISFPSICSSWSSAASCCEWGLVAVNDYATGLSFCFHALGLKRLRSQSVTNRRPFSWVPFPRSLDRPDFWRLSVIPLLGMDYQKGHGHSASVGHANEMAISPPAHPSRSNSSSSVHRTGSHGHVHRQSFAENLRGVPPSPRSQRHPSLTQAAIQDLLNHPPAPRPYNPRFVGRDWRDVHIGELVSSEDVKWVEMDTSVEDATMVCSWLKQQYPSG